MTDPTPAEIAAELSNKRAVWLMALVREGIHAAHGRHFANVREGLATMEEVPADAGADCYGYIYPTPLGRAVAAELEAK